ncbi:type III secretion system inner membrane ring lipoprotein SctJ [uncultured Tateyamaria sp.]|nr:type III secretion inner membrane ring lipoprotein SctJ [uncultured Tateyamaria sp.]
MVLITIWCFTLAGCKEVLFSGLAETEANEMVAVLAASGLSADRERDKDNIYAVLVSADEIAAATTLLRSKGFPRPKFQSLGEVFAAEGIVGTPFEQHVRYIHAMNEELSKTINLIGGVKSARVLVTAPPKDRYATEPSPASASVVINHEHEFDTRTEISKIKTIVAHSVPNLDYDNVAVALFLAAGPSVTLNEPVESGEEILEAGLVTPIALLPADTETITNWILPLIGMLSLALAGLLMYLQQRRMGRFRNRSSPANKSTGLGTE